jgi:hypothetical protein
MGDAFSCLTGWEASNATFVQDIAEDDVGPIATMLVESTFQHQVDACRTGIEHRLLSPGFTIDDLGNQPAGVKHEWSNAPDHVASPTRLVVQRSGGPDSMDAAGDVETSGNWGVATWPYTIGSLATPVDVSCMYEIDVDIWWTTFHVDAMPSPEWSIYTDG